jgi:hypothetical protein
VPECTSDRVNRSARRASRSWDLRGSWLSVSSRRSTAKASSGRDSTLMSIALSTRIRDDSRSGSPATSLSKVCSVHTTVPSGGFLSWGLDFFLAIFSGLIAWFFAADFALARSFSMVCSGASTTT